MLVEWSVVEQRYRAVLAVLAGESVTSVAVQVGVSRQSLHKWLARYHQDGLGGLMDRPRRPQSCPWQSHVRDLGLAHSVAVRDPETGTCSVTIGSTTQRIVFSDDPAVVQVLLSYGLEQIRAIFAE